MPDEKPYSADAAPEPQSRVFIVVEVCGRPKSVELACTSLMEEISSTLVVLKELQRGKYPTIKVHQTQVEPAGVPQ